MGAFLGFDSPVESSSALFQPFFCAFIYLFLILAGAFCHEQSSGFAPGHLACAAELCFSTVSWILLGEDLVVGLLLANHRRAFLSHTDGKFISLPLINCKINTKKTSKL